MPAEKNPYIEGAYQKLKVISQSQEKRLEYEAREKAIRVYRQGMLEAEERGKEQINRLNALLIQDGRIEDLTRAVQDKEFQWRLMEEYGIRTEPTNN